MLSRVRERQPNVFNVGCICHLADLCASSGVKKLSLPVDEFLFDVHFHFDRRYTSDYPDSLTCRQKISTDRPYRPIWPTSAAYRDKSAIFADMADIGSISEQIDHICRYGRQHADVGGRSALLGQKIGTYLPYFPIWPTLGRRRQHIGTNRPYLPIWPTSGRRRQHIGTNRPYSPIWPTTCRRRQKIGTTRPEDRNISAIFADMADIGSISRQSGHIC